MTRVMRWEIMPLSYERARLVWTDGVSNEDMW